MFPVGDAYTKIHSGAGTGVGIEGMKTFPAEALLGPCPTVGRGFSREAVCGPITSTVLGQTFWIQNLGV